jgi:actin-related protein
LRWTFPMSSVESHPLALGVEARCCCAEALFDPSLVGEEGEGLADIVAQAIRACGARAETATSSASSADAAALEEGETTEARPTPLRTHTNVYLTGGTSMLSGLGDRLQREVRARGVAVDVILDSEREHAAWLGASITTQLTNVPWVSGDAYRRCGPAALHAHHCEISTVEGLDLFDTAI